MRSAFEASNLPGGILKPQKLNVKDREERRWGWVLIGYVVRLQCAVAVLRKVWKRMCLCKKVGGDGAGFYAGCSGSTVTRPGSADLYSSFGSESGFNLTSINHKLQPKAPHQKFKIRPPVLHSNLTCHKFAHSPHYNRSL